MSAITIGSSQPHTVRLTEVITAPTLASWPARFVALYVVSMPLIAGIPRGSFVPMLRLTEVMQLGLSGLAVLFAAAAYAQGKRWSFVIHPLDWWMIAVGFFGSIVPVVSLAARGETVDVGAAAAAFPMCKYLLLWLLVRFSVRTIADLTTVLLGAVSAAIVVAVLAVPEGLGIGPTGGITRSIISGGATGEIEGRAFTLLGSAISSGAVIAICAAITLGFVVRYRSLVAAAATALLMLGVLATGQMSSVLAILVVLGVAAWQHRVLVRSVAFGLPALMVASLAMAPIIETRLAEAASGSLLPQSWLIRWVNVTELYWPEVRDGGWLIGVRPDTVLTPPDAWRTEVFLESGYLWTLWVGGLPFLVCFIGLLVTAWRSLGFESTNAVHEIARVGARAVIVFMAVFNIIDPHLSLRGGADLLYILVPASLAFAPISMPSTRKRDALGLLMARDFRELSSTARIQIGEIGGVLLQGSGWPAVSPGNGYDRGVDVRVTDQGVTIGEARLYFAPAGSRLEGLMLHPVRSVDQEAGALVWRGIALCARSMHLRSLMVPPGANALVELTTSEIAALGAEAHYLEARRAVRAETTQLNVDQLGARISTEAPAGVRLEPPTPLSPVRRFIDVVVSGVGMIVFAPFALIIAGLIRRSSPGPVLFRQMRVGAGGRPFPVLKFRSMDNRAGEDVHRESIIDAMTSGTPDQKIESDPRITKIGGFIRSWSLDEVPQLLNVWRGEMTLVGPRPSLLWETSLFESRTRRRLQLTPGIAGLWQASGRGDLSTEEMLELDLEYADTVSLTNDAKIVAQTAVAVVKKTGAR